MRETDILFERLIRPIENQMIRIIWRITRDPEEVKEVFQNVLEKIWRKLEKIDRHSSPHAYILRICVTCSYDALRRRTRRQRYENFSESLKSRLLPNSANDFEKIHDQDLAIHEAIDMLPDKQGKAVVLRSIENLSYFMIGKILGCSETTARSHFSKGKARLGKILSEMGISI